MGKRLQFTPLKPKKERLIYFTTDMNSYVKAKNEFNERVDPELLYIFLTRLIDAQCKFLF